MGEWVVVLRSAGFLEISVVTPNWEHSRVYKKQLIIQGGSFLRNVAHYDRLKIPQIADLI
jgi:hypothetical protein